MSAALRGDIYAISLYTDVGDVQAPALIFSFNTGDHTADLALRANPPDLVDDFVQWIRSLGNGHR